MFFNAEGTNKAKLCQLSSGWAAANDMNNDLINVVSKLGYYMGSQI